MKAYINKIVYTIPERIDMNPPGRLTRKTGIRERHITNDNETASDLAQQAANKLFAAGVDKGCIDFLILCTQSPDYFLPTTACLLQDRLGLPRDIGATDIDLGCSGYEYGLGLAKGLIESDQAQNVLLLTAETYSKYINPEDHSVWPLFGDGATATLISGEDCEDSGIIGLVYGTDGSGGHNLIVPGGGMKHRFETYDESVKEDEYGNKRSFSNLYMNGSAIMEFGLERVPETVEKVLQKTHLSKEEIDYYVFHQANRFMLQYLQQKCGLLDYPFWNDVKHYGNTVSSSIPIALTDLLLSHPETKLNKVMLVGFGVGLSWAGCVVNLSKIS